ncbi:MAG: hypothetical protein M3527_08575, partial [Actinomycetota bacterium]|nr:hypothetical protein [Actinomycetota bacterium]
PDHAVDAQQSRGASGHSDVLHALDDDDLEELTDLLFPRLRTRLRQELIVDRERAGLLTDFR